MILCPGCSITFSAVQANVLVWSRSSFVCVWCYCLQTQWLLTVWLVQDLSSSASVLQESLEAVAKENKELQAQISQLAADLDGRILHRLEGEQLHLVSRVRQSWTWGYDLPVHLPPLTGDGIESEAMTEEIQKSYVIPDRFESHEEMVSLNR